MSFKLKRTADGIEIVDNVTGNGVRNLTACPLAGVCHTEAFDTTAYAAALFPGISRSRLSSGIRS